MTTTEFEALVVQSLARMERRVDDACRDFTAKSDEMLGKLSAVTERVGDVEHAHGRILGEMSVYRGKLEEVSQNCPLHDLRLRQVEKQNDKWSEVTGEHHIIQVQQLQENAQWWKRWVVGTAGALFVSIATAVAIVAIQGCMP